MRFIDSSELLAEYIPEQRHFRRSFRYCLPKVFSNPTRHWHNPEAFAFSRSYFETLGHCPDKARKLLKDTGLVEFSDDYCNIESENKTRYCQQATPTPSYHEIQLALQAERFNICNPVTNKKARKRPATVTVDGVAIEGECAVDVLALQDFILEGYKHCKRPDGLPVTQSLVWRDRAIALQQFAIALNGTYGCVPQFYDISPKTNRIHGVGLTIQNMHRDLRTALLNGCHTADIENCFFTVLSQLGKYPAVEDYANNAKPIRYAIANDIGSTYEPVKISLLSMLNGATVKGDALALHLGNTDTVEAFWNHPTVKAIYHDCRKAQKDKGFATPKQFASFLMREEQRIARVMSEGTRLVMPLHDGIVTRERLDEKEIENRIKTMTGYRTTITTKRYTYEFSTSRRNW